MKQTPKTLTVGLRHGCWGWLRQKKKMLEARDKGTLIMLKSLVILSPVVTWKINEMNLPKTFPGRVLKVSFDSF